MQPAEFADATLLILAHGSSVNAESAGAARQHAAALRGRRLFADVQACFWKQSPTLAAAVAQAASRRLFVVPLFMGPGYFTDVVIPGALGLATGEPGAYARVQRRGQLDLYYAEPVGTHPAMTGVVLARAREVVARHPFPQAPHPAEIALCVAGHGTERTAVSRFAVELQVKLLSARREYAEVHAVFMEDEPRVGSCYELAQARNIVLVPFFISDGLHVTEDIPVLLGEDPAVVKARLEAGRPTWRNPTERRGKRVWYAPGMGSDPRLSEVILERVREAAQWDAPA